jgi:tripartite motif-containing protein 71
MNCDRLDVNSVGNFTAQWGTSGTGDGQFNRPDGILFDGSEKLIYVTDRKNNRIQPFNADGQFISKWKTLDTQSGISIKPRDIGLTQ